MKLSILSVGVSLAVLTLSACTPDSQQAEQTDSPVVSTPEKPSAKTEKSTTTPSLDVILEKQTEDTKARYAWRHPKETLQFFGLESGMTVIETLPGGGWYSKIIAEYLGKDGTLVGVNYNDSLWPKFGLPEERVAERIEGIQKWANSVAEWVPENTPKTEAYTFDNLPETLDNKVDMVLFIRSLHNLSRFNQEGYLDEALKQSFEALKPGGVLGIVQHETSSEIAVDGSRGYMNENQVIEMIAKAGFQLVAETQINHNPNDKPEDNEIVWRLPPGLYTSQDDPAAQEKYKAIGESNRMTLKFIKPKA